MERGTITSVTEGKRMTDNSVEALIRMLDDSLSSERRLITRVETLEYSARTDGNKHADKVKRLETQISTLKEEIKSLKATPQEEGK
jgi:hypothetical protein